MPMPWIFVGFGAIFALISLVCAIIVATKMLQNNRTALGVVTIIGVFVCGIGYIFALIFGWQNRQAWGLQKVMPILTGSLILSLILYGVGYGLMIPDWIKEFEKEFEKQQQQSGQFEDSEFEFNIPTFEN
jgi:cytochrome bd-type quinol oxidase subunit 1